MSPSVTPPEAWSLARRIAFRFACAYLVLLFFPFPLDEKLWQAIVPWVGKHVLRLSTDINVTPNGSGDTTFSYVQALCCLVLAVVATGVWSVQDARRPEYAKAYDWLRVYVRYVLAVTMLSYGMSKVFKLQFPFPSPERLMQPYGESSPMGLLWTFMGYSTAYNVFTGGAEVLGGVLLFFRRTTTLGALVVAAVMANVVMLNFCYDVPVKLYSTHLLLLALFLTLPDVRRLLNVLILNRPTEAVVLRTAFPVAWQERGSRAVKVLFVGSALCWQTYSAWDAMKAHGDDSPPPALFGLYQVESFTRTGQAQPTATPPAESPPWRAVAFKRFNGMTVRLANDTVQRFRVEEDAEKKTLSLVTFIPGQGPTGEPRVLNYSRPDPEHLVIEGTFQNEVLNVRLKRMDTSQFLLVNRGFHWVSEFPFNR
jgi:uncharacterized membrane protein YphA (DoxX/SURF4 family)